MNSAYVVTRFLEEYDMTRSTIRYLLQNTYQQSVPSKHDMDRRILKFYHIKTDELVLETETEIMAVYYTRYGVWTWAWSIIGLLDAEYFLSREILLYALKLDVDLAYIKRILTTSRGVIKNDTQIDINLAVSAGITKKPYIFPIVTKVEGYYLIYYMILIDTAKLDALKATLEVGFDDEEDVFDTELLEANIRINKNRPSVN